MLSLPTRISVIPIPSLIGFDCVVLATDSFFMAMFFSIGAFCGRALAWELKYFLGRLLLTSCS
jgi:hypothetical protein